MQPKPVHLHAAYAAQFEDECIAASYHTRPPYPPELFDILEGLLPPGKRRVLDLGCGTGDVALGLVGRVEALDAVECSAAMLRVAGTRPHARDTRLRWTLSSAEAFTFDGPYSLVVAAESLHWMDWSSVLPRIARSLEPAAHLALVSGRRFAQLPWATQLLPILAEYSTNRDYRPYDLVAELTHRRLFRELGQRTTEPVPFTQSLDDYVESFHTRNGFSRQRMTRVAAQAFDRAVRQLVLRHQPRGIVQGATTASVTWGLPV